jgi:hypothetical protein
MPIINQQILNTICESYLLGENLSSPQLINAIDFSNELIIFLQILS